MAISEHIQRRVDEKKTDYTKYGFTRVESNALKTFFDLAQEFESIEDVYQVSVAIPRSFFKLHARLYVIDPNENRLALVANTEGSQEGLGIPPPREIKAAERPYCMNRSMVLPIRGNEQLMGQLPFKTDNNVIGILEVYPCEGLDRHEEFFFEKYANRIGFSMHMRFFLRKNVEHVRFIKGLVADIEHNVIVPNMVYKLFLRRLRGKILKNREIEELFSKLMSVPESQVKRAEVEPLLMELAEVNNGLTEEFSNIEKHYENTSLFLETLLRKSHFDEGRLTLHTKACNMKKTVIAPQLEGFVSRFAEKGIAIYDKYSGTSDEEALSVVDVGLMAQVYGNLFSNAFKYTQEVIADKGEVKKYIAYGRKALEDYFAPGKDGVRYNVFSTGPHILLEEREKIFDEGYRGVGSSKRPGTGHGLAFIKNAVEIHGGVAGYEAIEYGNDFYFVLPE